jgi:hypothetical protein
MVLSVNRRDFIKKIKALNDKIRLVKQQEVIAVRRGNINLAAKLRYGSLVIHQNELCLVRKKLGKLNQQLKLAREQNIQKNRPPSDNSSPNAYIGPKEQKFLKILFEERDLILGLIDREKRKGTFQPSSRSGKSEEYVLFAKDLSDLQPPNIQYRVNISINPDYYVRLREKRFNQGFSARKTIHIALKQLFRKIDLMGMTL